jgi:hypothetical protein
MDRPDLPPSLTLSHEELVLLIKLFGAKTIPGLPADSLPGLPEEHVNLLLASAERNLRARGLLFISPKGKISVERFALALLGSCVAPEFSAIGVRARKGNRIDMVYYHAAQMMTVEHLVTGPGLHTFAMLKDRQNLFNRLVRFVNLDAQTLHPAPGGQLNASTLTQAIQAVDQGPAVIKAVLTSEGAEPVFVNQFARDLVDLEAITNVTAVHHMADGQVSIQRYSFIECAKALWEYVETGQSENCLVDLKTVSGGVAKNRLWKIIVG